MLDIGDHAPEFTLPAHDGAEVSLTTLLNRGPLLLYFYAADFAATCQLQARHIARIHPELQRHGLVIAGVSPQSPASHARFRSRLELPQLLLADEHKAVIHMYDVAGQLGLLVRRVTYLIDPGRIIRGVQLADFRIAAHVDFMLDARPLLDAIAVEMRRCAEAA